MVSVEHDERDAQRFWRSVIDELRGTVGAEALPQIACTLSSIDVYSAWMADVYNDCTAVAVQATVDRTPRGAFNPPF